MREYFVMKLASSQWTSTLLDIPVMTTAQKHSYVDGRLALFSIAFFSLNCSNIERMAADGVLTSHLGIHNALNTNKFF